MMDKYSALTIGLTLITIGGLGLYETLAESPSHVEAAQELPPTIQTAGAGKYSVGIAGYKPPACFLCNGRKLFQANSLSRMTVTMQG